MTVRPADATAMGERAYTRLLRRRLAIVGALVAICLAGLVADLMSGPSGMPLSQTLATLIAPSEAERGARVIVWQLRMPVALIALLVGAALSLAGAEMQTILDNPLASPFTLGVSSAASFGAATVIVLGVSLPGIPPELTVTANAFAFAFASVLLIQALSRRSRRGADDLVLFGIALVFAFEAAVSLLQFLASSDALQQLVFWNMGSLARADWRSLAILACVVAITVPFSLRDAWRLTALRLGEDRARSFGIDVARLRLMSLLRVSLLAATAVAFVGSIGFVGLVGPHIARMLIGEDQRFFLPASALTGAALMSLASIASKSLVPGALIPIGIVTAFVGLPVFLWLILGRRDRV